MPIDPPLSDSDSDQDGWPLLLAARRRERAVRNRSGHASALAVTADRGCIEVPIADRRAALLRDVAGRWRIGPALALEARVLVELYLPLLGAGQAHGPVVAHLGQSLDARIATLSGHAFFVTGPANLQHLHRLRALVDAVVVGGGTVGADDPRLTTRLVEGENPVRVVIDRTARTPRSAGVFHDGFAQTLLVCALGTAVDDLSPERVIRVSEVDGELSLGQVRDELGRRGLRSLFIEGGGVTVSRWMRAGLLDRLQICVAPLLVGEGRDALQLPGVSTMHDALRAPYRLYRMGEDVLWDFDLASPHVRAEPGDDGLQRLA